MKEYKQLSYEERTKLAHLRQSETSPSKIALIMGRSKATISRELKRNEAPPGQYWPDTAQKKAMERCRRGCRIDHKPLLRAIVVEKLCTHYWTPEQIAGWLKHRQTELPSVSHETIYTWLYQKTQRLEKLWKFLPRHKAVRGLRKSKGAGASRIQSRVSIHDRPKVVDERKEFGHFEGDLMSFQKNSGHIVVLRERLSMFTLSTPLPSKRADDTTKAMIDLLMDLPKIARKTVTFDNGGEFAGHEKVAKTLGLKTFFCDPYASWQKGGVENTNGRLRRDLPRNTNIHAMSREDFDETIDNYNSTPRKSLNWLTPLEAFLENLNRVALQT